MKGDNDDDVTGDGAASELDEEQRPVDVKPRLLSRATSAADVKELPVPPSSSSGLDVLRAWRSPQGSNGRSICPNLDTLARRWVGVVIPVVRGDNPIRPDELPGEQCQKKEKYRVAFAHVFIGFRSRDARGNA